MNMHPHAWPLFNVIHLLGIKFSPEGMEYAPILPQDEYSFSTPLVGFEKSPDGYSGWYHPSVSGTWKIIVELGENEIKTLKLLEINGKEVSITSEGGSILFSGESTPDIPLQWTLKNK